MDSEYPPLPSSKSIGASLQNVSLSDSDGVAQGSSRSGSGTPVSVPVTNGRGQISKSPQSNTNTQVIVDGGDLILEYTPSKQTPLGTTNAPVTYRWKVFSESLIQSSPYFRVFLDPEKFSEGRNFMKQRELHSFDVDPGLNGDADATGFPEQDDALPIMRMPENHLSHRLGPDTVGFFLRVLSFNSFNEEEKENFNAEVKSQRPLFIAGVIEMADAFNSPQAVRDALKRSGYTLGKPKLPLTKFNPSMLKLNEDRVRQSAFIARFLNDRTIFQMLTHALIVSGSRFWVNGLEAPELGAPSWHYFANGIEEELYYRRQCVLDTITDLQAHFLRVYGALEDPSGPKRSNPSATSTSTSAAASRQYQCRCALGNSSACDTFHLGQMTRFFSLRTKTIFIGSTLLDPDFKPDIEDADADGDTYAYEDAEAGNQPERPPDITSVISLLKQCPDYQIDSNHTACGIRRRFLPSLDCIEGFVGDERGLLGVNLNYWRGEENRSVGERKWPNVLGSWANRSHRRAYVMDLRLSRISGIPSMSPGSVAGQFREEDARLLFTAKKRNWES